jgi:hypothetical protein
MTTLSIHELATESAELLPARETLDFIHVNYADVWASNSALALNAVTAYSTATANAAQTVLVGQH